MMPISLAAVARVTGGTVHRCADPDLLIVTGDVVTDSRAAEPGSLYVARIGEHADGHRFIGSAAEHGAVAALTSRPVDDDLPHVVVTDVQDAFAALARWVVDSRPDLFVVGITGSSGKTSTKDLLGGVLELLGPTIAPEGSFNSEVGVPLTVCRVRPETCNLVVEMGARGTGHIRYLTEIAPPRVGVVLNVGTAHMGEFGSREAIAVAKAELVEALAPEGLAVLNGDDPAVRAMADKTAARIVFVGESAECAVRATDVTVDHHGCASYTLVTPTGSATVQLGLVGRHHVANSLSVAAVALEAGLGLDVLAEGLGRARLVSRWRMEVTERADGVTIVNDAYNANPDSMRAALDALASMSTGRRSWAVLGSMLELGPDSDSEHRGVGEYAIASGVDDLVVVGAGAISMAVSATAGTRVRHVPDAAAAGQLLKDELRGGDVVLFKSSRDAGLRWLGDDVVSSAGPIGVTSEEGCRG